MILGASGGRETVDESVSPEYIEGLLEFTGLTLADDAFHDTRLMLEQALGMLQLRVADSVTARAIAEVSEDEDEDGEISSADGDDDDAPTAGGEWRCRYCGRTCTKAGPLAVHEKKCKQQQEKKRKQAEDKAEREVHPSPAPLRRPVP